VTFNVAISSVTELADHLVAEHQTASHIVPEGGKCFWVGWGRPIVIMDADRIMTISYDMNKMGDENGALGTARTNAYVKEIYLQEARSKKQCVRDLILFY
jgi:hypothetical protein